MICLSVEQYEKLRRLATFAEFYIDGLEPSSGDYNSDKEDITDAQAVFKCIDSAQLSRIKNQIEKE
jgi:hypothetical protein